MHSRNVHASLLLVLDMQISSLFVSLFVSSLNKIRNRSIKITLKWFKFDDTTINFSSCCQLLSSLNDWDIEVKRRRFMGGDPLYIICELPRQVKTSRDLLNDLLESLKTTKRWTNHVDHDEKDDDDDGHYLSVVPSNNLIKQSCSDLIENTAEVAVISNEIDHHT